MDGILAKIPDVLLGAIIGAAFGFISSIVAFFVQSWWSSRKQRQILASSFYAEIRGLVKQWEWSTQGGLKRLSENQLAPRVFCMIPDDFFTVYNKNADKIGMFDKKLATELVSLYIDAKGFVATIKTWEYTIKEVKDNTSEIIEKNLWSYFNLMAEQQDRVFARAELVKLKLMKYL